MKKSNEKQQEYFPAKVISKSLQLTIIQQTRRLVQYCLRNVSR